MFFTEKRNERSREYRDHAQEHREGPHLDHEATKFGSFHAVAPLMNTSYLMRGESTKVFDVEQTAHAFLEQQGCKKS